MAHRDALQALHDPVAEKLVIGSILIDGACLEDVAGVVSPADFANERCRLLYRAALELHKRGVPIDTFTLQWEVEAVGGVQSDAAASFVAECVGLIPTAAYAKHYAARVRDLAERRRALIEAKKQAEAALDLSRPVNSKPGGILL